LNAAFPDYEFSKVNSDFFTLQPLETVVQEIGNVLSSELSTKIFDALEVCIGPEANHFIRSNLLDSNMLTPFHPPWESSVVEIFRFLPDEKNNPFGDEDFSLMWVLNYLFFNRKLKRVLLLTLRGENIANVPDSCNISIYEENVDPQLF
jgi:hypothetical protein